MVVFFFFSGEPPLSYSVEKRRDPKNCAKIYIFLTILAENASTPPKNTEELYVVHFEVQKGFRRFPVVNSCCCVCNNAIFGVPPLLNTITQGGFTGKRKKNHHITDNAFSYIRTEFGALRSRRLAVKHVGD